MNNKKRKSNSGNYRRGTNSAVLKKYSNRKGQDRTANSLSGALLGGLLFGGAGIFMGAAVGYLVGDEERNETENFARYAEKKFKKEKSTLLK